MASISQTISNKTVIAAKQSVKKNQPTVAKVAALSSRSQSTKAFLRKQARTTSRTALRVSADVEAPDPYGVFSINYDVSKTQDDIGADWKEPINVAVSGAAGQISNHLLFMIASGEVYGKDQPICLSMLGSERSFNALEGVAMELEDSLYPLLREVRIGIKPEEVFLNADWALLIGAKPRGPGMERSDLLEINGGIFAEQGKALDKVANKDVKVMVVGNPCNTNALICLKNAPSLNPRNFHALTRLDENRAKCQLAVKAGKHFTEVTNVTIWGNHSTTQVPDFVNAKIGGVPAPAVIDDQAWLEEEFTPIIQTRGGALIKKWGRSSAASTAVSIADSIKALVNPTAEGDWFSSAVLTTGNTYGVAEDIIYSLPCKSKGDGSYEVVEGVEINDWLQERINKSEDELTKERECVKHLFGEFGGACEITEDTMLPGEM